MVTPLLAMHLSNAAISVARVEPAVVEVDADEDVAAALGGVDELSVDEQPVNTAASTAAPPTPMVTRRIFMKTPSRSFGSPHPLRR
ncbi:hypothetical protein [Gordonia polyisoprenivorans]|uniref:hypothetical protein n=1 Tax=Gordonia polyisoprenivorans TaxID=84595 RepID=UPI0020113790|nr:hypothetical protein [Gordonia polyisoprenivorans]